jgi:hypothetical protein
MNLQELANTFTEYAGVKPVVVRVDLRGVCAGQCCELGKVVRINEVLTKHEHLLGDLIQTLAHEVAHSIDIQRNGHRTYETGSRKGKWIHHDKVFYDILSEIASFDSRVQKEDRATHDIKELKPSRKYREFSYNLRKKNASGEWEYVGKDSLKTIRHNKLQKGRVEYYQWPGGSRAYRNDFIEEILA